jgi:hypothetical protein
VVKTSSDPANIRARQAAWQARYQASPEGKAALARYKASPEGKRLRLLITARRVAKVKGWAFNITLSDVIVPTHCPVFGVALDPGAKSRADNLPSLDRLDSTKGYVRGNVWVISWRANRLKSDATLDELRALVRAIEAQSI